ncbi:MAG: T9SS type A sorting domain-containing protein, partial [bacterium]
AIDIVRPESVLFDSANQRWLCSLVGEHGTPDGSIVVIDESGSAISKLTTGLDDPKGIVIANDKLYVTDVTKVRVIDPASGELLETIPIAGAQFLNDICFDGKTSLYLSDNAISAIFTLDMETKTNSKFCNVDTPNGLLYDEVKNTILAVSFSTSGKIYEIDLTNANTIVKATVSQQLLDGITRDNLGNYYISSWQQTNVVKYDKNFTNPVEFQKDYNGPADIYYETQKNILVVPEMEGGKIHFYPFSSAPTKPSNLQPAEGTANVSTTPNFSWSKSENAVGYIVSISKNWEFPPKETITVVIDDGDSTNFKQETPALNNETIYFWYVEAVGEADIVSSDTLSFATLPSTKVEENTSEVVVYPNPCDNFLTISSEGLTLTDAVVEIYNIESKLVYKSNYISNNIDITNIEKGSYFLILKNGKNTVKRIAFIKN